MFSRFVAVAAGAVLFASVQAFSDDSAITSAPLGTGSVESYAAFGADGAPTEIGVVFSAGAFDGLPQEPSVTGRCFDVNRSGAIEANECEGDHEVALPFPAAVRERADIPFEFAMLDWNPHGHDPEAWSVPHFDMHFYSIPPEAVRDIALGPCGYFIDCAAFERAVKPVPAQFVHGDHADVGAAVGWMGNHLIDTKSPELNDAAIPFTHTWIFGAFDGRIIFHEVMATHAFLTTTADLCADIKQPEAWERAGYYPTRYCFRRDTGDGSLRVFMSDFVMRHAAT